MENQSILKFKWDKRQNRKNNTDTQLSCDAVLTTALDIIKEIH